jgi:hypothetical protein
MHVIIAWWDRWTINFVAQTPIYQLTPIHTTNIQENVLGFSKPYFCFLIKHALWGRGNMVYLVLNNFLS